MLILTIRTDKPEAELGLFRDSEQLAYETWQAHRELAETIHQKILEILKQASKGLNQLEGVVVFKGPGSFTGLRIGLSVANALAYGLEIPVVAGSGEEWREQGITRLKQGEDERTALPEYGAPANITPPRK